MLLQTLNSRVLRSKGRAGITRFTSRIQILSDKRKGCLIAAMVKSKAIDPHMQVAPHSTEKTSQSQSNSRTISLLLRQQLLFPISHSKLQRKKRLKIALSTLTQVIQPLSLLLPRKKSEYLKILNQQNNHLSGRILSSCKRRGRLSLQSKSQKTP